MKSNQKSLSAADSHEDILNIITFYARSTKPASQLGIRVQQESSDVYASCSHKCS